MKAEYRKRIGKLEPIYERIPMNMFYQAESLDDGTLVNADTVGTIIRSDDVVYLDSEPCKLSTLVFVIEEE